MYALIDHIAYKADSIDDLGDLIAEAFSRESEVLVFESYETINGTKWTPSGEIIIEIIE